MLINQSINQSIKSTMCVQQKCTEFCPNLHAFVLLAVTSTKFTQTPPSIHFVFSTFHRETQELFPQNLLEFLFSMTEPCVAKPYYEHLTSRVISGINFESSFG